MEKEPKKLNTRVLWYVLAIALVIMLVSLVGWFATSALFTDDSEVASDILPVVSSDVEEPVVDIVEPEPIPEPDIPQSLESFEEPEPEVVEEPVEVVTGENNNNNESTERVPLTDEEAEQKKRIADEYIKENATVKVAPIFGVKYDSIRASNVSDVNWDMLYFSKGEFIWWLENEANQKVMDIDYKVTFGSESKELLVETDSKNVETLKEQLTPWLETMFNKSAYGIIDETVTITYITLNNDTEDITEDLESNTESIDIE